MKEQIYRFLEEGPASSEQIASEVMRLQGALNVVADKVVTAAVNEDRRFAKDAAGLWYLKSASEGTPIREAVFLAVGVQVVQPEGLQVAGIAGCRIEASGSREVFSTSIPDESGDQVIEALQAFGRFGAETVPVAFHLPRVRETINRVSRRVCGYGLLDGGICLFRLGRRVFPERALLSVDQLAEAAGLSYLTERNADTEANLQADLLLFLLEQMEARGINTVEGVLMDLHPDTVPVDFEAFAFDEVFLDELPDAAGVYVMRDREGRVIYIGKSVCLRDRVRTYFASRSERPEKTRRILDRIWSVEVETVGSELEALLLEARMIRACKPEFNTQVEVHEQERGVRPERHFVMVLPSDDPESIELFCVRRGRPLEQIRVCRGLSDWQGVEEQIHRLFFETPDSETPLSEADWADREILKRWMVQHRERVNWMDMERAGSPDEALRVLKDYVVGCDLEGWEKVWRV